MKTKVKLCIIGSGRAGMIHARNFHYKIPQAEVIAISDMCVETAKSASVELDGIPYYCDYLEAIEKSGANAVVIATPTKYHCEIAVAAAKRGLHIFCEKPMAMDTYECEQMIRVAKENNVILQIGFMRRSFKDFIHAKEMIDSGAIGKIVTIRSLTRGPSTPHEWMYDIRKSNGPLAEVNSHDIDALRWFSESEPESVYALGGNYRCPDAKNKYPDFYDTVVMNIKMKNGVIGCIEGAQGVGYGYDARMEILGTKGMITVGNLESDSVRTYMFCGEKKEEIFKGWRELFISAYENEDRAFIDSILKGKEPLVGGEDGLKAVAIVSAGNESIITGKIIKIK